MLAAAVDDGGARRVDAILQSVSDAAEVVGVVGERVDVDFGLVPGHARQVRVLDDLQSAAEELDANAELVQAEAGRLDQHDEVALVQLREGLQDRRRFGRVEVEERRVRQRKPIGRIQTPRQLTLRIRHDDGPLRCIVLDGVTQNVAQILGGGSHYVGRELGRHIEQYDKPQRAPVRCSRERCARRGSGRLLLESLGTPHGPVVGW